MIKWKDEFEGAIKVRLEDKDKFIPVSRKDIQNWIRERLDEASFEKKVDLIELNACLVQLEAIVMRRNKVLEFYFGQKNLWRHTPEGCSKISWLYDKLYQIVK